MKKRCGILFLFALISVYSLGMAMNAERFANASDNSADGDTIVYGLNTALDKGQKNSFSMIYTDIGRDEIYFPIMTINFYGDNYVPTTVTIRTDKKNYNISSGSNLGFFGINPLEGAMLVLVDEMVAAMFKDIAQSEQVTVMTKADGKTYTFELDDKQKNQCGLIADEYTEEVAPCVQESRELMLLYMLGQAKIMSSVR